MDIDNYEDCFDKVIKVAYRFSPQGKQGKEIWCNLTGGSNPIQLALLSMSRLTAVSIKHYFISQSKDYRDYVKVPHAVQICPNKDKYFNIVPFLKFSNVPAFNLHKLKGKRAALWSVTVQANWRITFQFQDGDAKVVNYEDYH